MKVSDLCGLGKTLATLGIDQRCVDCSSAAMAGHDRCHDCHAVGTSRSIRERCPSGPGGRTDIDKAWGY